jgi:long-chain acyl-CoA synthetase
VISLNVGALIDGGRPRNKVAVIDFDGEQSRSVTFGALDALGNGVARALVNRGFRRGDPVGILATNSSFYLAIHLGIMRAGLVSVPINFRLPAHLIGDIVKDCGARLVFCDVQHRALLPDDVGAVRLDKLEEFSSFVDHFLKPLRRTRENPPHFSIRPGRQPNQRVSCSPMTRNVGSSTCGSDRQALETNGS